MEEQYKQVYLDNVKKFAIEFKKNSAYLINRFFNGYSKDKMRRIIAMMEESGITKSNSEWIDKSVKSYKPITPQYIDYLKYFAFYMSEQKTLEEPMTVWRGCDTLEDGAVEGLVASSSNRKTAEGFNYGTLLKINLPKGMKIVRYSDISNEEDVENEVILPPCDYKIKSEGTENINGRNTRIVEIDVEPKDLLREFSIRMTHPVKDYITENGIDDDYKSAYMYLTMMLTQRTLNNTISSNKIEGTGINGSTDVIRREELRSSRLNKSTNMYQAFSLMNSSEILPSYLSSPMKEKALDKTNIDKQITTKEFFDYVRTSKSKQVFFDYENTAEHEKYYIYQDHGVRHADNVTMFTYYIASKEGYTEDGIRILMEAARYHDIGRTNSWQEGGHGFKGAQKYSEDYKKQIPLHEQQMVGFLIQAHDLPNKEDVKKLANRLFSYCGDDGINVLCDMAYILRDADALDRTRFPIYTSDYLNSTLLTHNSSKELIQVAQTINYREDIEFKKKKNKNETPKKRSSYEDNGNR